MRSLLLIATLGVMVAVPQIQEPDISKWAAKDMHQGFVVAADSYADAARSKEKFGKGADPYEAGLLAVDVYFRNDMKFPVHVDLSTIRLDVDDPNGLKFHLEELSLARAAIADSVSERRQQAARSHGQAEAVHVAIRYRAAGADDSWLRFFRHEPPLRFGAARNTVCAGREIGGVGYAADLF